VKPAEVAQVLAKAAAFDRRTVGRADVAVWAEAIGHLDLAEALDAVTEHYQAHPGVWLEPGHVLEIVRRHRRNRLSSSWRTEAEALATVDPDDAAAYLETLRAARHVHAAEPAVERAPECKAIGWRRPPQPDQADINARGRALAEALMHQNEGTKQ
jgi:hypothetical protein